MTWDEIFARLGELAKAAGGRGQADFGGAIGYFDNQPPDQVTISARISGPNGREAALDHFIGTPEEALGKLAEQLAAGQTF